MLRRLHFLITGRNTPRATPFRKYRFVLYKWKGESRWSGQQPIIDTKSGRVARLDLKGDCLPLLQNLQAPKFLLLQTAKTPIFSHFLARFFPPNFYWPQDDLNLSVQPEQFSFSYHFEFQNKARYCALKFDGFCEIWAGFRGFFFFCIGDGSVFVVVRFFVL